LEAKEKPGTVVTKPFRLSGKTLQLNVAAPSGSIKVELLDLQRAPIPGFSGDDAKNYAAADELRLQPRWKDDADLSSLQGRIVRLRFQLQNAKLYSFAFK